MISLKEARQNLRFIVDNYETAKCYIMLERGNRTYRDDLNVEHYPLFIVMFL